MGAQAWVVCLSMPTPTREEPAVRNLWTTRSARRGGARLAIVSLAVAAAGVLIAAGPAAPAAAAGAVRTAEVAWGDNFFGTLGDGTNTSTSVPVRAAGLTGGAQQIAGGGGHTLAVNADGEVWAWGDNSLGQLGDGTRTAHLTPQRVPGINNAVAVAAGNLFSLAVLADGSVKAWGYNGFGQLGTPAGPDVLSPITVPGVGSVVTVAAGHLHSLALRSDGTVWGWGDNGEGQLGDGTQTSRSTPAPVHNLSNVRQLVSGSFHAMALGNDGNVRVWGHAGEGQVGNGQFPSPDAQLLPALASVSNIVHVAAGDLHSLAVRADGSVWAWGWNLDRQVADNIEIIQRTPVRVNGLPSNIVQVAGAQESSVALDAGGSAWTWGRVRGNPIMHTGVPFKVAGLTDATAIAAGQAHYLAIVKAPFSIGLNPAAGTVAAGSATSTLVRLTPATGYTGTATLAVSGLPSGVTATLTSPTVGVNSPSIITFRNPGGAPAGTFPITVTATDPTAAIPTQTATYVLTVAPAPKFTIALSLTNDTIPPGGSTSTDVSLTPFGGFNGTATLSIKGLPAGVTATFTPSTVSAAQPATLTLTAAPNCPFGTYNFTVGASVPGAGASAGYQLTVAGDPSS
jgi:alpha-tubulin suppressor-like RCC1 family protein